MKTDFELEARLASLGYYPDRQIGQKFINHNARMGNYLLLQLRAIWREEEEGPGLWLRRD